MDHSNERLGPSGSILLLGFLSLSTLGNFACALPTAPTGSSGPEIQAQIVRRNINGGTVTTHCEVRVLDFMSGEYLAGAQVTLEAPGNVSIPLPEVSTGLFYDGGNGWTYQPGGTYTVVVKLAGVTYRGSILAAGAITIPPSGTPITWAYEGNQDVVSITKSFGNPPNSWTVGEVDSPVDAAGAYPETGGDYDVFVGVTLTLPGGFPNAYPVNSISSMDQLEVTITK